ncbi:para-aminobenzoate synthase, (PABA) [Oleoguttula sp. CCFEE 5521]
MSSGRILFIDAHDSFSNNIVSLLRDQLHIQVELIHIDDPRFVLNDDAFHAFLQHFDAVVAGPGPGHPANPEDVGLIGKLWSLPEVHVLPLLGICLGFQSLALASGATVERLKRPRHGLVTPVVHCSEDVYAETGEVAVTQYHSLHARLSSGVPQSLGKDLWRASPSREDLLPLAWDLSDDENGPILMSARHRVKPFWGVQYHPESICSNTESHKLIVNWWRAACNWSETFRLQRADVSTGRDHEHSDATVHHDTPKAMVVGNVSVQWLSSTLPIPLDTADIVEALRRKHCDSNVTLLESCVREGLPVNAETGRYSIIGIAGSDASHVQYWTHTNELLVHAGGTELHRATATSGEVLCYLHDFMHNHRASDGPPGSPFWGGMVGFVSYEAGLETIDVEPAPISRKKPDIWFVFVERSVVINHVSGACYVQSLIDNDGAWLAATRNTVINSSLPRNDFSSPTPSPLPPPKITSQPLKSDYCAKVTACQSHLRAGLSYELCLTAQTHILTHEAPWSLYLRLRAQNPAPFAAYLNLTSPSDPSEGVTLISSSPERFLSWTRGGEVQFRPIKGTVKKSSGVTREKAEVILKSPKEQAENLMIVDLIRHDLSGVANVSNVHVPQLMQVEEYTSLYQLVSVVSGILSPGGSGIPVLAASLPPGSMTGAPKKRSCALLTSIEDHEPRGLYSGVLGYMDVGGGGDFSVVIRSAFKYADESVWRIGAGGAVTVLSDPESEWEEMCAKREKMLGVFGIA